MERERKDMAKKRGWHLRMLYDYSPSTSKLLLLRCLGTLDEVTVFWFSDDSDDHLRLAPTDKDRSIFGTSSEVGKSKTCLFCK